MIDTHAHLFMLQDLQNALKRAKQNNVKKIINICTDIDSLEQSEKLNNSFIFKATGITPHDIEKNNNLFFEKISLFAKEKKLIAIGEIGLDYFYKELNKKKQIETFEKQLFLAQKEKLPVLIHARESFNDIFIHLKPYNLTGVFHCFTGTFSEATKILDLGFYISFSGILTFKNAISLRETAKKIPLDKIVLETDCPFLAPQKFRKKQNEPSFIIETFKMLSTIKNKPLQEIEKITTANATKIFPKLNSISIN